MWIHQELCDFTSVESRLPCNRRKGWSGVRTAFLIVSDDMTGRAPVPSQLLSVIWLGGRSGLGRDRSPDDGNGEPRAGPKGHAPFMLRVLSAKAQERCSSANHGALAQYWPTSIPLLA